MKHTDLQRERVLVQFSLDGGDMLATRSNPLAVEMASMLTAGGLGKHSQDELQSLMAGRTVNANLASTPETFVATAQTSPQDLELQLQLMAAFVTDPGYRPEGEQRYRLSINNFFAQRRATPSAALSTSIGGILSDNDPRFTLQPQEDYQALTFAKLKADIGDRLARGAMEIGVVGDIDEAATIAAVARTFGALPTREAEMPNSATARSPLTAPCELFATPVLPTRQSFASPGRPATTPTGRRSRSSTFSNESCASRSSTVCARSWARPTHPPRKARRRRFGSATVPLR
jgi:zinc protease